MTAASRRRPARAIGPRRRVLGRGWRLWPVAAPERAVRVDLPCQWQQLPAFATASGPFVYRLDAALPRPPWRRVHLVCDGVFYDSVWRLNGEVLGSVSGGAAEVRFDVTDLVADGLACLEVEVRCPPDRGRRKTLPLGVFAHWDCLPDTYSAGGIWRPVYLEAVGDARIAALWLETLSVAAERARVVVHATLDLRVAARVDLRLRLDPPPGRGGRAATARLTLDLPAGRSALALPLALEAPLPWQPWSHSGRDEADRYLLSLVARTGDGPSARASVRVGLRTVAVDADDRLVVNGHRMFVKGWNYGPSAAYLAASSARRCADDVRMARERGLDALRVHAHLDHPGLYAAADRYGLLLFQDGPLQWTYAPTAFADAAVELRHVLARVAPHPSVVRLTAHNEPVDVSNAGAGASASGALGRLATLWHTLVWSDNRDVWDRALVAALPRSPASGLGAGTLHVASHSGVVARRRGEDSHLYMGWYPEFGPLALLDRLLAVAPGVARWVSEFGAQSLPPPETARAFVPERPTAADWRRLERERMAQAALLERNVGIAGLDRDALVARTQAYQAALCAAYIDRLRSRMGDPVAGFFGFLWADAVDGVTWALLDSARRPKRAYLELKRLLEPFTVVALLPLAPPRPGRAVRVPIVAVNDTDLPCETTVAVRTGTRAGDETHIETLGPVTVPARAARSLGAAVLSADVLAGPGALHVSWSVAAGTDAAGVRPAAGERAYPLPSPLWRSPEARRAGIGAASWSATATATATATSVRSVDGDGAGAGAGAPT